MHAQTAAGRLRRAYKTLFPLLNATFEAWLLVRNVAYLFDQTPYYRPWLSWIGVDLRRVGIDDLVSDTNHVHQTYNNQLPSSGPHSER